MTEKEMQELDKRIAKLSAEELRICLTEVIEAAHQDNWHNPSRALDEARKWGLL